MSNRNRGEGRTAKRPYLASRMRFVTGGALAVAALPSIHKPAKAAQFEFKCGTNLPTDHPVFQSLLQMWSNIERQSGGRIHTQTFPDSQLGSDSAMLGQVRSGALEFYWTFPAIMGAVVPAANVGQLGFAFRDEPEAIRVMSRSPLGDYVRKEMQAQGMFPLQSMWTTGMYAVISNIRPIRVPDDFRGFKIRVASGKIVVDLFKDLGASPLALAANEIYMALQTKLVDGTAMGLISMDSYKVWEVGKYISLTNHVWSGFWTVANADVWKKLPPDLQAIVERNHTQQCAANQRESKATFDAVYAKMVQRGLALNAVDPAPFVKALAPYYKEWAAEFGPTGWDLLQSSLGRRLV